MSLFSLIDWVRSPSPINRSHPKTPPPDAGRGWGLALGTKRSEGPGVRSKFIFFLALLKNPCYNPPSHP